MRRDAFTMIELVFVIVVLGILAAIAVPKMAATRVDAEISKGQADAAAIRSAIIAERQQRLIKGDSTWITAANLSGSKLFDGVLMYGITAGSGDGHWSGGGTSYTYKAGGSSNTFTYDPANGTFICTSGSYCQYFNQ
jgi:general secretion pathway protein G